MSTSASASFTRTHAKYLASKVVARSTTVDKRPSKSDPRTGIVTWETAGFDSDDQSLVSFKRSNLIKLRHPGTASS